MDDFNSSDVELGPEEPSPFAHYGAQSIEAMFNDRYEDRIKTKKRMAQLQDTKGAPGTVRTRTMWMNRFEAYMTQVRGLSAQQVPTGDDIARFAETIAYKMIPKARDGNKLVPNLDSVRTGIHHIMHALSFKFDFTPTRQECKRIDAVLDRLVKEGKLIKGRWRKRERVGFYLLRILGQAWFAKSLKEGCLSWDITISKFLPVSLCAATGSRSGDITRSAGYTGLEYMRWEHIELVLESRSAEPTVQDMTATITLAYEKGKKDILNRNKVITIKALDDVQDSTVCPIKLLLVHALRTGHVAHTSIGALLAFVLSAPNRTVQWTNKHDPVVPAIHRQAAFLDFTRPAGPQQVVNTVRAAGLLAAVLEPLQAHDIRAGVARDVTKLPTDAIKGAANPTVAKMLGHSHKSLASGITDNYIGPIDTVVNTLIAENAQADRHGPKVGQEAFVKRRIPIAEVAEFCKENSLDYSITKQRNKAFRQIHARDQQRWSEEQAAVIARPAAVTAPALGADVTPLSRKRQQSVTASTSENNGSNSPLAEMSPNVHRAKRQDTKRTNKYEKEEGKLSDAVQAGGGSRVLQHQQQPPTTPLSTRKPYAAVTDKLIDPQLLGTGPDSPAFGDAEEADDSTPVDPVTVSGLESLITTGVAGSGGDDDGDEEGLGFSQLQMFRDQVEEHIISSALEVVTAESGGHEGTLDNDKDPLSVLRLPGTEFVDFFSKINVVRNKVFARKLTLIEEVSEKYVATGNSRDKPSMFLIPCVNAALGCDYRSHNPQSVEHHIFTCNGKLQQQPAEAVFEEVARPFACTRDGCTKTFRRKNDLATHIQDMHDFTPKKCTLPNCPNPDRVWSTKSSYNTHTSEYHDPNWTPSRCGVPGCASSTVFSIRKSYDHHLQNQHKLRGKEKEKYLPPRNKAFTHKGCPVKGCKLETVFKTRSVLKKHLVNTHKLEEGDELESMLDGRGKNSSSWECWSGVDDGPGTTTCKDFILAGPSAICYLVVFLGRGHVKG